MRKLLFIRYSIALVVLILLGSSPLYAQGTAPTHGYKYFNTASTVVLSIAAVEALEQEDDKYEPFYIECSTFFLNGPIQGLVFFIENLPYGRLFSYSSSNQYLVLRVFRI
jgi:hypothetical protein